jgi:hypothetical protein
MPDPVKLDTSFGSYATTYEVKDGQLVFTRKLVQNAATIPVEQYNSVRSFLKRSELLSRRRWCWQENERGSLRSCRQNFRLQFVLQGRPPGVLQLAHVELNYFLAVAFNSQTI